MIQINEAELPCPEPQLRQAVIDYIAARQAHVVTIGQPAPWPAYEIVRAILADADNDFVVVSAPNVRVRPPCPNPETMDFDEQLWDWVENPVKVVDFQQRLAIASDGARLALVDRLRTATPSEIDQYVDQNVTDVASARVMFKRVLKVLALLARS